MNRRQRMKNRATAHELHRQVSSSALYRGATISIGVDLGAPGGDVSAVAWVQVGQVLDITFASGARGFQDDATRRFCAVHPKKVSMPLQLGITREGGST